MTAEPAADRPGEAADWIRIVDTLGPRFAARAAAHDEDDSFVSENYAELKQNGVFSAAVPPELGGGGASHAEICAMLRTLAHHCSSTALAVSMHTHLVALAAWRWRHEQAPVEPLLRRVASEQIVLVSSGGSDWLPSGGRAERAEGGYRVTARKRFSSGTPVGEMLMTSAVLDDPDQGPTVLHFGVPLNAPGVSIEQTWRAMGMRATGSHDIVLDGALIPDKAIAVRRPQGKWHPLYHRISMIAIPIIYAVYVGVAEAARDLALKVAAPRRNDPDLAALVGTMETELVAAQLALKHMIDAATGQPGPQTTNAVFIGRALAARASIQAVEAAMEVAGGAAFYRDLGLERLFRDVQGARFHPMRDTPQKRLAGRMALGVDIDD
jgi:alkylation response protein AidB-like acyl-CoA dehydrogenase